MKRTVLVIAVVTLLLNLGLANAITQQEINEAKSLVDSKADCKSLSDSQLEIIGEYYMEQMHPGEAHTLMHKMMGLEEGSDAEKQFHVNLARTIYCGEGGMMNSGGMMNMMMGGQNFQSGMMQGMMGNPGYLYFGYWSFLNVLYVILLIGLIILIFLGIIKLWRGLNKKRR